MFIALGLGGEEVNFDRIDRINLLEHLYKDINATIWVDDFGNPGGRERATGMAFNQTMDWWSLRTGVNITDLTYGDIHRCVNVCMRSLSANSWL